MRAPTHASSLQESREQAQRFTSVVRITSARAEVPDRVPGQQTILNGSAAQGGQDSIDTSSRGDPEMDKWGVKLHVTPSRTTQSGARRADHGVDHEANRLGGTMRSTGGETVTQKWSATGSGTRQRTEQNGAKSSGRGGVLEADRMERATRVVGRIVQIVRSAGRVPQTGIPVATTPDDMTSAKEAATGPYPQHSDARAASDTDERLTRWGGHLMQPMSIRQTASRSAGADGRPTGDCQAVDAGVAGTGGGRRWSHTTHDRHHKTMRDQGCQIDRLDMRPRLTHHSCCHQTVMSTMEETIRTKCGRLDSMDDALSGCESDED